MPAYHAYEIEFASELPLPLLQPGRGGPADVTIALGPIETEMDADAFGFRNWSASRDSFLFEARGVGRLLVSGGRTILAERAPGASDAALASIILGSGLAALLMQRRILPLHAGAIAVEGGAVLIVGRSGAGKSTLLAALIEAGRVMMADDVTGVLPARDGTLLALPCGPAIRLWQRSLALLGRDSAGLAPVREDLGKFYAPVARFHDAPLPVRAVVYLSERSGGTASVHPIGRLARVECLSRFVFRKAFLRGMDLQRLAFERVTALAGQCEMIALHRPAGGGEPAALVRTLTEALALGEPERP